MDRRIGAQFYTLRDHIRTIEGFDEACRKVKDIGYQIIQISGTPLPAKEMKEVVDRYGLEVVTTHRGFEDFVSHIDEIIDYNRTLGCELCGIGCMPEEYRQSRSALERFIREADTAAAELEKEGLFLGYHNHAFEFAKLDGKMIMDCLLEGLNPKNVRFILDTYWVQAGGKDPAKFIRLLGKRTMAVHFKDMKLNIDNTAEFGEIGEGNLDWDEIIAACDDAGVKWALVEQDICRRDPFESMKMSYDYLKTKGFC